MPFNHWTVKIIIPHLIRKTTGNGAVSSIWLRPRIGRLILLLVIATPGRGSRSFVPFCPSLCPVTAPFRFTPHRAQGFAPGSTSSLRHPLPVTFPGNTSRLKKGDRPRPKKLSRARRTPFFRQLIFHPYQFPFLIAQGTGFRLRLFQSNLWSD